MGRQANDPDTSPKCRSGAQETSRTLVRVLFVLFGIVGAGEIAYIVLWIVIPKASR